MTRKDWIPSLVLLILSLLMLSEASRLPYTAEYGPGPGFLPMWISGALCVLSALLLVRSLRCSVPGPSFFARREGLKKASLVAGLFLLYIVLLPMLGLLISLTVFLLILLKWVEHRSVPASIGMALAGSVSCYLLFEQWLKVPLPIGILGI